MSFLDTFLSGHFNGDAVAERAFAFACRVHFVLDAAVDHPKLDLRTKEARGLMRCGRVGAKNRNGSSGEKGEAASAAQLSSAQLIRNSQGY